MTPAQPMRRGALYFCFANPTGFSGQKAATELVMHGLSRRGWSCRQLPQPAFDHVRGGFSSGLRYGASLLSSWLRAARLLARRGEWLWIGLGQTRSAFVRDAIPLLLGRLGLGRSRIVVALNGSLFMHWASDSVEARAFRFLLRSAGTVAVVGERQRAHLLAFGLPHLRVEMVVNSCGLEVASTAAVTDKHARIATREEPLRCLYMSSLIDTKGFPEYLEALLRLSVSPGPRIDAVLCGQLVASEFSERFRDFAPAEDWIRRKLDEINRSARVSARWINGASGADKLALFHAAQIFVLPTRYAVEAQPLALLEAMASGCAIVTTRVGEIPTILHDSCAVLLSTPSSDALAAALQSLVADAELRASLALAAHARFVQRYGVERHLDRWETLLQSAETRQSG